MKAKTQLIQVQQRRTYEHQRIGPNCNRRIAAKTPSPNGWYLPVAALVILICLANPVPAQFEGIELGALPGGTSEYCSTDTPRNIPDQGTITSFIAISDAGPIGDLNVKLNITNDWNSDLDIFLIAPDGTRVELFTDVGGSSSNFRNTILDDEAAKSIKEGSVPFTGSFRPEGSLADLIEKELSGTWTLEVSDDKTEDVGRLESWCLIATIGSKEPLAAPVIQCQASVPGGIHDVVSWDDLSETREYGSTVVEQIPEQGTMTQALGVDDLGMIEDLNVKVNFSHEWDSELDVYLIAPDAARIELFTDVGGSQDNFIDTILDDESPTPITAGTAPFTGRYRPEGTLIALIGKDIHGQWKLEVTDDSWYASGKLNSWSLIANLADVLYYVQCATDAGFGTVVANSGWTANQSHTFAALDPQKKYWYRVKARPAKMWSQTSRADFITDTLSATVATNDGDVELPTGGGGDLGSEIHVIENPSFELETAWMAGTNNILVFLGMGIYPGDIWVTDGSWVAGVIFTDDFSYSKGDIGDFVQRGVDWTGVETLVLDFCSTFGSKLRSKVLIGNTEVWSHSYTGQPMDVQQDVTIDVSSFTGPQDLKLRVEVDTGGRFLAGVFWDNLRTYGPSSPSAGTLVSTPITIGANDTWDVLTFGATTPAGTQLTVDVLPETGSTPIAGYANVLTGTDLSGLNARTIRLRANLSTSDPAVTPALHFWSVDYSDATCESEWSNVAASLP